jgi:uncharacterized surface protein with fasciclin (FAS1) repeats
MLENGCLNIIFSVLLTQLKTTLFMKQLFFNLRFLMYVGVSVLVLASCRNNDDEVTPTPEPTIAEIAAGNPDFSLLVAAAAKVSNETSVNVLNLLSDPNQRLTVFAPNNAAFAAAGFANVAAIQAASAETLLAVLSYHVLTSVVPASAVPAGPNAAVPTFDGVRQVFATRNSAGVFINGIRVTTADINASNGVIHVVERVLLPPAGNIVEVAQGNPDFSLLVAAVLRASQGTTDVAAVLSGTNPFTVFAPTNAAFQAAGFADVAAINAADPNTLAGILTYHVVNGRVFSSDLSNGATPATLAGATVTINLQGNSARVTGQGNGGEASNITATNIMATNGVVHVIDRVLLPPAAN